ncbi:MAG TPA: O-acetyl-ADP-ribose deacetylase [Thermoplasmatales archaeon]|nr:O-acetyl-ADP-ribose deacetylase [Thermoplasmatales archaeon]
MQSKIGKSTLEIVVGDITQDVDAIVNAANNRLTPGGGVSGAIHRAAGPKLWKECKTLGGCKTGEAKITKGYNLPASYVIHTVGPRYSGSPNDAVKLASCYRSSIQLASRYKLKSIAFPAISTGIYGYPMEEAAKVALSTIVEELKKLDSQMLVRLVLFDKNAAEIHERIFQEILKELE